MGIFNQPNLHDFYAIRANLTLYQHRKEEDEVISGSLFGIMLILIMEVLW